MDRKAEDVSPHTSPSWLLGLMQAFHTTLDVEELIRLCSEHLQPIVPHAGIEFREVSGRATVRVGEAHPDPHRHDVLLVGQPLGVLLVSRGRPFDESETRVLETVASTLAHPLRNALLYRDAVNAAARDPLTGINNRASLELMLEREVGLARRYSTPLSVIMVDADRFKDINDTYGHLVGDSVLKALVRSISACVRDSDLMFRYGGEEFLIVLSNTSSDGAALLAERIRTAVAGEPVRWRDVSVALTVSLGVAGLEDDDDPEQLLNRADQALYRSKVGGRNRVTVLESALGQPASAG